MTWFNTLSTTEYILIFAFIIIYSIYAVRMVRISRQLHTGYNNIFIKLLLRVVYFSLLIISLLGPSFGADKKEVKTVGKDIFFAVDLSESMNAQDIAPSRLRKVKYELKNLVEAFSTDKMGLIIFSSEAFIQCPLTFDQSAVNLFIETLSTELVPNSGTDFAPPLAMALSKFQLEQDNPTQQKSKVIILISDGEDFGDESTDVAKELESYGIKVFTLGVGTEEGARIPDANGFKKDQDGNVVVTELNPDALEKIASITNADYFELSETKNDIPRLINTINNIEGELQGTRTVDITANKYYYFLGFAFLLLVLDVLISIKTFYI